MDERKEELYKKMQEKSFKELFRRLTEEEAFAKAEKRDPKAQRSVGDAFYYGCIVEQNKARAFQWYQRAAEQGDGEAQWILGIHYLWGSPGLKRDLQTAIKWLRLAAENGIEDAQAELDFCYASGLAVEMDL
ncbi:MAG: tetratricopeptide repeat protein [Lachnospiraceae bacterium]|nr:tetratricopeptide repeat protein [Lachnospiraceae bacterium]